MVTYVGRDLETRQRTSGYFAGISGPVKRDDAAAMRHAVFVTPKREV